MKKLKGLVKLFFCQKVTLLIAYEIGTLFNPVSAVIYQTIVYKGQIIIFIDKK